MRRLTVHDATPVLNIRSLHSSTLTWHMRCSPSTCPPPLQSGVRKHARKRHPEWLKQMDALPHAGHEGNPKSRKIERFCAIETIGDDDELFLNVVQVPCADELSESVMMTPSHAVVMAKEVEVETCPTPSPLPTVSPLVSFFPPTPSPANSGPPSFDPLSYLTGLTFGWVASQYMQENMMRGERERVHPRFDRTPSGIEQRGSVVENPSANDTIELFRSLMDVDPLSHGNVPDPISHLDADWILRMLQPPARMRTPFSTQSSLSREDLA